MNVLEIISSLGPVQKYPRLPVSVNGFGMPGKQMFCVHLWQNDNELSVLLIFRLLITKCPRMDDEEDDVFEPDPHSWRTTFREVKCEDRGTQTPGPALALNNGMLPCGVAKEPRPLFYGEADDISKEKMGLWLCVISAL